MHASRLEIFLKCKFRPRLGKVCNPLFLTNSWEILHFWGLRKWTPTRSGEGRLEDYWSCYKNKSTGENSTATTTKDKWQLDTLRLFHNDSCHFGCHYKDKARLHFKLIRKKCLSGAGRMSVWSTLYWVWELFWSTENVLQIILM